MQNHFAPGGLARRALFISGVVSGHPRNHRPATQFAGGSCHPLGMVCRHCAASHPRFQLNWREKGGRMRCKAPRKLETKRPAGGPSRLSSTVLPSRSERFGARIEWRLDRHVGRPGPADALQDSRPWAHVATAAFGKVTRRPAPEGNP